MLQLIDQSPAQLRVSDAGSALAPAHAKSCVVPFANTHPCLKSGLAHTVVVNPCFPWTWSSHGRNYRHRGRMPRKPLLPICWGCASTESPQTNESWLPLSFFKEWQNNLHHSDPRGIKKQEVALASMPSRSISKHLKQVTRKQMKVQAECVVSLRGKDSNTLNWFCSSYV
jgi:hypothetical protein